MKVIEIMTRDAKSCTAGTPLTDVARLMWNTGCGVVPVVDAHARVIGIITDRDIGMAVMKTSVAPSTIPACQAMTPYVRYCRLEDDITSALSTMKEFRVRRLPVLSPDHRLQGILSIDDIVLRALAPGAVSSSELIDMLRRVLHARSGNVDGNGAAAVAARDRVA
jgi:CBS domain-containing protein